MVVAPATRVGTVVVVVVVVVVLVETGTVVEMSTGASPTRDAIGAATPMATTAEMATATKARLKRLVVDTRVAEGRVPGITRRVCPKAGLVPHGQNNTSQPWCDSTPACVADQLPWSWPSW